MGHSRTLWKLKPKTKTKNPSRYRDCPLCNKPLLPRDKKRVIWVNRVQTIVHDRC